MGTRFTNKNRRHIALKLGSFLIAIALVIGTSGCPGSQPGTPSDPANQDAVGTVTNLSEVTGSISSLRSDLTIGESESAFAVFYTLSAIPSGAVVSSFFSSLEGINDPNQRSIISTGLPTGTNQVFSFDPLVSGVGSFRVGVLVEHDGDVVLFASTGVIRVEGPPNPRFIQPCGDPALACNTVTQKVQGASVPISFDAGDPEDDVHWRLFYLTDQSPTDVSPEKLGVQIAQGRGNVGSFTLDTSGFSPGDYNLGLSATDSGFSISTTVDRGELDRIVTVIDPVNSTPTIRIVTSDDVLPPTISITAPSSGDVVLFGSEPYTILLSAAVHELGAIGLVDLFHDTDTDPTNGYTTFVDGTDLPVTTTSFLFPTNLAQGTYRIGGVIRDGISPDVFAYASGQIIVVRQATLIVTAPNTNLPIRPSIEGETPVTVDIEWETNVPPSAGTVDVYARRLDPDGDPEGPEIEILAPTSTLITTAQFSSESSGLFDVFVRLNLTDETLGTIISTAPQPVLVSSTPAILWLGALTSANPGFDGAIFEGVNFEDNVGTSFTMVNDLDGDGTDELLIDARYGKPFFNNTSGVGMGEAYLLYGSQTPYSGTYNLNSVGTAGLTGVTFTGIRTPQASSDVTDGLSSVSRLPDVDGDGRDELVFGFPRTKSRGHNMDPEQDGVVNPLSLATLEREDQFMRGGIVIVSSRNSILLDPTNGSPVINLDLVGQDFAVTCVDPEPEAGGFGENEFYLDVMNPMATPACDGNCIEPKSGRSDDANGTINYGFVKALARDYWNTYVYSSTLDGGRFECPSVTPFLGNGCYPFQFCRAFTAACEPTSPGLHGFVDEFTLGIPLTDGRSGFYSSQITTASDIVVSNNPREPLGARIIGVGLGDAFGTSLTLSNSSGTGAGDLIVSAPNRTARGILRGPEGGPEEGGEIDGLGSSTNPNSGVAYMFDLRSLWTSDSFGRVPPRPHQYIVGEASHCGGPDFLIPNIEAIRIAGFSNDNITNIVGIDDFNDDGLNDFAIGAPDADGGKGRVYVAYRRSAGLEGDYVLEKLALDPTDPERLTGVLITTSSFSSLGAALVSGLDFNGDGLSDLVIGSPTASNGLGEIIVVFGDPNLQSALNGISVETLLTTRTTAGLPRAARITGNILDANGNFGFNVANGGDIDGDGLDDLLVSTPNASPRFDPDPTDADDILSEPGIDGDLDGVKDDVSGPLNLPDGRINTNDDLENAGIVYVIFGSNRLDRLPGTDITASIDQLGTNLLRGFMIVGRGAGDRLGGGDAGDTSQGGIAAKFGRGRSFGLASAGDIDGDGRADIVIGSILADPRRDPNTGVGVQNAGEVYLIYGSVAP